MTGLTFSALDFPGPGMNEWLLYHGPSLSGLRPAYGPHRVTQLQPHPGPNGPEWPSMPVLRARLCHLAAIGGRSWQTRVQMKPQKEKARIRLFLKTRAPRSPVRDGCMSRLEQ